ncbi:hypothetical protein GCM10007979_52460 [Nocardioides albus]|nr:hypothetical protein GCM10007979_52460 [Nocardioides albus]
MGFGGLIREDNGIKHDQLEMAKVIQRRVQGCASGCSGGELAGVMRGRRGEIRTSKKQA